MLGIGERVEGGGGWIGVEWKGRLRESGFGERKWELGEMEKLKETRALLVAIADKEVRV